MPVLNFSYATVKKVAAFKEYISKAAVLMEKADIEVVVRGEFVKSRRGPEKSAHIEAVFRYPDMATAESFYTLPEYLESFLCATKHVR